ncbi:MAG: GNAT family N-acetyltransferase [Terriglobales bacterium]
MRNPTLREYRPSDFNTLWELDQLCFEPGIAYPKAELRHFMKSPGAFTLVAEADSKIVGFILAHAHPQHGHIITIDVDQSQRRAGLGSRLLEAAEERLRSLKKTAVILEVAVDNQPAITFYKRQGYSVIKTIPHYYHTGLDALEMAKAL